MRAHWRWRAGAEAASVILMVSTATGQTLELGGESMPLPGEGEATLALVEALDLEIRELGRSGDPVAMELRRLARALLASGERLGPAGSTRVVTGRTILARAEALERTAEDLPSGPARSAAAAKLAALADRIAAELDAPIGDWELDRAIRDAFAPLTAVAGMPGPGAGWAAGRSSEPTEPPSDPAGPFADGAHLARLLGMLDRAGQQPAYAVTSARLRNRLAEASAAVLAEPEWLGEGVRRHLAEDLDAAAAQVQDPELRTRGLEEIDRIATIGRLIVLIESQPADREGRALRAAFEGLVERSRTERAGSAPVFEALGQMLALLDQDALLDEGDRLVRQLKPAWRIVERDVQLASRKLRAMLPKVIVRESPMTDPAVLAVLAERKRAIRLLRQFVEISGFLAKDAGARKPVVADDRKPVAARLLKLGQALDDAGEAREAEDQIRLFADRLDRFSAMRGEEALRRVADDDGASDAERAQVRRLTASRPGGVVGRIDKARADWLAAWAAGQADAEDSASARLAGFESWLMLVDDRVAIAGTKDPADRWPGWETSAEADAALLAELDEALGAVSALVMSNRAARVARAVEDRAGPFDVLRVWAAVSRAVGSEGPRHPLHELGLGPPDERESWGAASRTVFADLCRYAEEFAFAKPGSLAAEGFRAVVHRRARMAALELGG